MALIDMSLRDFLVTIKNLKDLSSKIENQTELMKKIVQQSQNGGSYLFESKRQAALNLQKSSIQKSVSDDIIRYRTETNKLRAQSKRWINVLDTEINSLVPTPTYDFSEQLMPYKKL